MRAGNGKGDNGRSADCVPTNLKFPGQPIQDDAMVSQKVEAHFARQLRQLDATTELALKLLKRNPSMTIPRALGMAPKVVIPLYAKLLKTVRSIRVAASLSLVEDAQVLCRTLAETAVAIRYILQKKSAQRAEEYVAHTLMRTKNVMKKWKNTPGLKRARRPIEKATDQHLKSFAHIGEKRLKELTTWYSGDQRLVDTFKRVGFEKFYQVLYLHFAGVQHVSDADRHIAFDEKGTLTVLLGSSSEGQMNMLLHTSNALLWMTIARVGKKFKLGYEAEIQSMRPEHRVYDALRAWSRRMKARKSAMAMKGKP
jgi:hypothetical protein